MQSKMSLNTAGTMIVGEPDHRLIRDTLLRLLGERFGVKIVRSSRATGEDVPEPAQGKSA